MPKPRPQSNNAHLIRGLWPLQGIGDSALKGRFDGQSLDMEVLRGAPDYSAKTPWGDMCVAFEGETVLAIPESPLAGFGTFTFEMWVRFDDLFAGPQVLLEHSGRKDFWRLALDPMGRLRLEWRAKTPRVADRQKEPLPPPECPDDVRVIQTSHLVDQVRTKKWYHLAVFNDGMRFLQICLTPQGELFPRSMRIARPAPVEWNGSSAGKLCLGGAERGTLGFYGAMCDFSVFAHLKRKNEFPNLGQNPPRGVKVTDDFPIGSALLPVDKGENRISVGCRPAPYHAKSMWFCGKLNGVRGKEIEMEIIGWPGSLGMLCSPWVSYDGWNWDHVGGAYWNWEEPHHSAMFMRHTFKDSPAWVAASCPYGLQEIDKLEKDVSGSPFIEVVEASRSCEGRPIRLFKITDSDVPDSRKRAIYIQTGQHSPPEMIAGRALDSAIRKCIEPSGKLRSLLKRAVLLFVPVVNQDTAYHGTSSSVACGVNLNRDWWEPRSPEIKGLKKYIIHAHNNIAPIQIAMDMHGGGWAAHTVLCRAENVNEEAFEGCHANQEKWLASLAANADFSPTEFRRQSGSHINKPAARGICGTTLRFQLKITAMTPEMSPIVYWDRRKGRYAKVTQRSLERMGLDLLNVIDNYLD